MAWKIRRRDRRPNVVAAVDLGSNSFHLVIARRYDGGFEMLDKIKEPVRLAAGLDANNVLADDARQRALDCLRRFGERLREMGADAVSVVGTNTLRKARNASTLVADAEAALGHPIRIVSGIEEARLVYLGVTSGLTESLPKRLVVDIGGGSTELVIGEGTQPLLLESLHIGCVGMTQAYFSSGGISAVQTRAALAEARSELQSVASRYREQAWELALGSSGTARAIAAVLEEEGGEPGWIESDKLTGLLQIIASAGHADELTWKALSSERQPVFAGGVVIMKAVFDMLGIDRMRLADGALREGVLYDEWGRPDELDTRSATTASLKRRFDIDDAHAEHVAQTAFQLYGQVAEDWQINNETDVVWLGLAAELHEMGLAIAHAQHHKHGAYIAENADLAGFSQQEQRWIAALIRSHRRRLDYSEIQRLCGSHADRMLKLACLLRLAVLLNRSRTIPDIAVGLRLIEGDLLLTLPVSWLDVRPQTARDIEAEQAQLLQAGIVLNLKCVE